MNLFVSIPGKISLCFACFILYSVCAYGKIYDCFIFFDELELLQIRLNELADVVDKFVLVEMEETHQGNKKPMYFGDNSELFRKFQDKIIYVPVSDRINTSNPWVRIAFQRNQIMKGLIDCADDDIILISDADEIVRHDAIKKIGDALNTNWIVRCKLRMFRFFLNMETYPWIGTFAVRFKDLKGRSIEDLRNYYVHTPHPLHPYFEMDHAGWHFTSQGGLTRFGTKLESFTHAESNTDYFKSQAYINLVIKAECECVKIDDSFPSFVLDHLDAFKEKGFICE